MEKYCVALNIQIEVVKESVSVDILAEIQCINELINQLYIIQGLTTNGIFFLYLIFFPLASTLLM